MEHQTKLNVDRVVNSILAARRTVPAARSVLVAVSGIDGSGKGFITDRLVEAIEHQGLRVAALHVDGWLNLPDQRFDARNPAEHFYLHAIRFEQMFAQLVMPLRDRRSVHCEVDEVQETATAHVRRSYEFSDVDVIVLEGIFLLKRAFQGRYDLSCWIDCTFETALTRAIARAQEGMPPDQTVRAYHTIYFPAQRIHFERDDPMAAATLRIDNEKSAMSA